MTALLTSRFDDALLLASKLHRDQTRKGSGAPYLSHLLRTAGLALEYGANEDEAIAALLHDAVEDCGGLKTLARIREAFGDPVADIVLELSDSTTESSDKKAPWRERKERYIEYLRSASYSAALIVACDKIDNVASFARALTTLDDRDAFLAKFKAGKTEQLWYFNSIVEILKAREIPVAGELERFLDLLRNIWVW